MVLVVNGDSRVSLGPGALIGRTAAAALRLDDPAISEAHAIVSLRAGSLRLLSLRGRFVVDGQRCTDLALSVGLTIELAPGQTLEVAALELPSHVAALRVDLGPSVVPPPVVTLAPDGALVSGLQEGGAAVFWASDEGFRVRLDGLADRALAPGEQIQVGAHRVDVVLVPLAAAATANTEADPRFTAPLSLVVRFDTVHIFRGADSATIDGLPGRLVSELALIAAPIEWRAVAQEIWPEEPDERRLRMNWDAAMGRLRRRLREIGLRTDLVRSLGGGRVELFLGPEDRVTDAS